MGNVAVPTINCDHEKTDNNQQNPHNIYFKHFSCISFVRFIKEMKNLNTFDEEHHYLVPARERPKK